MANLYDIDSRLKNLQEVLDTTDDIDVQSALINAINNVEMELGEKFDNINKFMKNLNSDLDGISKEITRLQDRKKSVKNKIDNLKKYMLEFMKYKELKKVETKFATYSVSKGRKSLNFNIPVEELINDDVIPEAFIKRTVDIDKKGITDYIKGGNEIEGISYEYGDKSLIIR